MTDSTLHEALHDVASSGVGPVGDVQLARMAAGARSSGRESGQRPWIRVAGVSVAAAVVVVVLLVAGLFVVTRPPEVVPASGPGSLPDQIFPTRQHILTLEQAPIGRVSLVYAAVEANGGAAWIAVGADSDEYRWVAPLEQIGSTEPESWAPGWTTVAVSPDGRWVAIGFSGDSGELFGVEVIDAQTGHVDEVRLGDSMGRLGGAIDALSWSPEGSRLFVSARVIVERISDTGRRWETRTGMVTEVGSSAGAALEVDEDPLEGQLVGWSPDEPVILVEEVSATPGVLSSSPPLVTAESHRVVGYVDGRPEDVGAFGLSPDGSLLAYVEDPTPNISGDGVPERLHVVSTASGDIRWRMGGLPEDASAVVGWSDRDKPVLYTGGLPPEVSEYLPVAAEGVRLVDLGSAEQAVVPAVALAQDILASGNVRVAEPPRQPWYDPRTLWPTLRPWRTEGAIALVLLGGLIAVLVVNRSRRRRSPRT